MKWLVNLLREIGAELKSIIAQFKRGETWLTLGLIAGFGLLTYAVSRFAFKTDSVLRQLRFTVSACRELTNGPIIFLFSGMIFFLLAVVVTFGEFQRYFNCKQHNATYEARRALIYAIGWCIVAISISGGGLLFFNSYCR